MAAVQVKENLFWVGVQDHDLRVFDVIMYTEYGTSYNAYVLKTSEGNILFETVKAKFFDQYVKNITEICPLDSITHIVVEHTEPDHVGSLEKLLEYAPNAKVVGSQVALNFLTEICNREIPGIAVDDTTLLKVGDEELQFRSVPFLHWPDSIYAYITSHKALITCDSFGCHYADDKVFNDKIEGEFVEAYKYYFDMIMGPFKPHVQYALEQIKDFEIDVICPGHGPVLRENLSYYLDLYDIWSREATPVKHKKPVIVNSFVSAYGYTEELAREISAGIREIVDADIKLYDMVVADETEVMREIKTAEGILFGTPTVNGDALPPVANLVAQLNGIVDGGKVAAAYGSYGWSGEGPDMLNARLNYLRMNTIEPALKINFKPSPENREEARKFGRRFGKKVKESWERLGSSKGGKTYWKCTVCGEVFEGPLPPMVCPVCGVGSEAFVEETPDIVTYESTTSIRAAIIGSGAAAISAAEAIRKRNTQATIDIYTTENILPYYRPVLTEMISEDVPDETFFINPEKYYSDNKINVHLNTGVEKINHGSKSLTLLNGKEVSYDKLLISTGANPFLPPIKGSDLPQVFTVRSNKDLDRLKDTLTKNKGGKVTVIGGGLLGLEAACAIASDTHEVLVIDTAPTILPRQTDCDGSTFLKKIVEKSQITIVTDTVVQEIYGNDKEVRGVVLANGDDYKTDIVVVSAGLSPNKDLAQAAGIDSDRAILVDNKMRTSIPDIYAAGDCAISDGNYYGVWEPALNQGRVAGANMAGDDLLFDGKQYPATLKAFGTQLFAMGNLFNAPNADCTDVKKLISVDDLNETYKALYFQDDKLQGALLIGNIALAAPLISGIRQNLSVDDCRDNKIL